jgi:hypothetical protein
VTGPENSSDGEALNDEASQDVPEATTPHISQLRVIIECEDWETAVAFYRDALGLPPLLGYESGDSAQMVLDVGSASIELVHPELTAVDTKTALVADGVPRIRLAFQSERARETVQTLQDAGAEKIGDPKVVPVNTLSARLIAPDRMPITVFQPLSDPDFAEPPRIDED